MATQAQQDMLAKINNQNGFIAALDQSGGSTPKALGLYGVDESEYQGDAEMFAKVHEMRTRIITSSVFNGERVLGAILFEDTLDRDILGQSTSSYLWNVKQVVPFLKVDKGLEAEINGTQLLKAMPDLDNLLAKANAQNVFGTKMRSVVKLANSQGVEAVIAQQFAVAKQILAAGLMPIIEPEVDIHSPEKAAAEALLKASILKQLDDLAANQQVMLKLTLPETANLYQDLVNHPKVLKVVALSGGYSRDEANSRLTENNGMIASFSRALSEGLSAKQSDAEFDATMDSSIESIYQASKS
ncbi:fructose bisphosphate aldolase [Paraglaciecola psychrophila]|jgi:fructose-bisphosphate aldolase class I|uniref:fructose-bisphosphate aldolase n=1 Tax=Paraglaciecola psychrophila 170 TaxID=1129794 RepID=K7AGG4_9ALTE|nr:fructose bisphosphate aldolase [Paraglaciecola psychrophila]AGH43623.1 fructose-1,6-bisphosphate aldolase [Paraglaciecola psychrophila 170]GAC39728.1 fructose-bisphosphate aldolase class 1 [Paraglaciecola psychrophila 170]